MELQCTKCKYQFSSERIPQMCPFCGGDRTVRTIPSAMDILSETEQHETEMKEMEQKKEEWKTRVKN